MELTYDFTRNGGISNACFEGLNGREHVTSTKEALGLLQVENPAVAFTRDVKAGMYDRVSDEEYEQMLHTVERISLLWRYSGDPGEKSTRPKMNVLMLLANAIEMLGNGG